MLMQVVHSELIACNVVIENLYLTSVVMIKLTLFTKFCTTIKLEQTRNTFYNVQAKTTGKKFKQPLILMFCSAVK